MYVYQDIDHFYSFILDVSFVCPSGIIFFFCLETKKVFEKESAGNKLSSFFSLEKVSFTSFLKDIVTIQSS